MLIVYFNGNYFNYIYCSLTVSSTVWFLLKATSFNLIYILILHAGEKSHSKAFHFVQQEHQFHCLCDASGVHEFAYEVKGIMLDKGKWRHIELLPDKDFSHLTQ